MSDTKSSLSYLSSISINIIQGISIIRSQLHPPSAPKVPYTGLLLTAPGFESSKAPLERYLGGLKHRIHATHPSVSVGNCSIVVDEALHCLAVWWSLVVLNLSNSRVAKNLSNSWVAKTFRKPMFSVESLKQSNRSYWWLHTWWSKLNMCLYFSCGKTICGCLNFHIFSDYFLIIKHGNG